MLITQLFLCYLLVNSCHIKTQILKLHLGQENSKQALADDADSLLLARSSWKIH